MKEFDSKNETGRSMIEMLGVLAIIGVLSVGGIAGYSKAMTKYRINKAIEQITLIAGNVRSFFAPQRNYSGLSNTVIKKAKLVPDEMWDGNSIKSVWGNSVVVSRADKASSHDYQAFMIDYGIPNDEEICIEILSQSWTVSGVTGVHVSTHGPSCGDPLTVPVSIDVAVTRCSACVNINPGNRLSIYMLLDADSKCNIGDNYFAGSCR